MCAGPRYEFARSPYNAQIYAAENLHSFSITINFMLNDQEKKSVFLVIAGTNQTFSRTSFQIELKTQSRR
jgi:hypothetical protein